MREGYAMKHKIIDIRRSLEYECFHSALALALTLPDVCGMIKYPYESRVGVRYINWLMNMFIHFIIIQMHVSNMLIQWSLQEAIVIS